MEEINITRGRYGMGLRNIVRILLVVMTAMLAGIDRLLY